MALSRAMRERAHYAFVAVDTNEDEGKNRHVDRKVGDKGAELAHERWKGPLLQNDGL